jgi:hypothetical protein
MADLKDKATWGLSGAIVAGIINLGIFAMKSDVSDLRAEIYREFVTRKEYTDTVQNFDRKLDKVVDALYNRK